MRIAIMGTGGMGGFLGTKLAAAGHEVTFIARGQHLETIKSDGLRLLSREGDLHIHPARAFADTSHVGTVDLILFCVKLYDTEQAAQACLPMMADDTFILTLQNGVESIDLISAVVGPNRTVGGAIYVSASISAPGVIQHSGGTNTIRFAEPDNQPSQRTEVLECIFDEAGLIGLREENLQKMLWSKFVLLCGNAGVGSLTDSSAVAICLDPDNREMLEAAMWEVYHIAAAMGVALPEKTVEDALNLFSSGSNPEELIASQCLDLRKGRKLELNWTQGTIHRLGKKYGVPTPINSTAYAALKRFADGRPNRL
ncbi:2-dehydropantoate 2-reductase [hydrothermal vent metagenome]|uniref:2-dehydropantoate 2-reductase n=1 Tax=hydrothermal vent metagenome TaxID=652676 RepID=A0A3B0S7N6_9ZZZZ